MQYGSSDRRGENWSREEVEATVADYLSMLALERAGQAYNKSEHRRNLAAKLDGRSDAAIERKHQNISAVLLEMGCPPIAGYKPLPNYQRLLFDVVDAQLTKSPGLEAATAAAVDQPAVMPTFQDFASIEEAPPSPPSPTRGVGAPPHDSISSLELRAIKRDYIQREAQNRSLGEAGELLVVALERWRLSTAGLGNLASRVLHASKEVGDGLGYDVLSFRTDGTERYIEVKTTAFGRETPFFVTQRELDTSMRESARFHVCRLFDFRRRPKLFALAGNIREHCALHPQSYRASFN